MSAVRGARLANFFNLNLALYSGARRRQARQTILVRAKFGVHDLDLEVERVGRNNPLRVTERHRRRGARPRAILRLRPRRARGSPGSRRFPSDDVLVRDRASSTNTVPGAITVVVVASVPLAMVVAPFYCMPSLSLKKSLFLNAR